MIDRAGVSRQHRLGLQPSPDRLPKTAETARKMETRAADGAPLPRLEAAGFAIDLARDTLLDANGRAVELRPQAWQVLRYLALHAGRLISKEELLDAVWPGVVVTDDSLVQAVGDLRRALGEAGRSVVKTVPRRGYLLVAAQVAPAASETAVASGTVRWRRPMMLGLALIVLVAVALGWHRWADQRGAAPAVGGPFSVAVLPFRDPQRSADGEALGRGIAADLVAELARSPDLRVLSAQSSLQFTGGGGTPLTEIARRLRSRYLVDGTVRRNGEQLRLAVELLDSESGQVIWSNSQTLTADGFGAAQLALVGRIAGTLQSRLRQTEERRALALPPKTLDVFVLTERGRVSMQRYDAAGMREARVLLAQALQIDAGYAPAWAYLGMTNTVDAGLRLTGEWTTARLPEVLVQVNRAIALQSDLPIAYVALSQAQALARNHDAALAAAQRCMELSPNDADCFYILGKAQLDIGQVSAAVQNLAQAMDRNPLAPAYLPAFYATALWADGRLTDAVRVADQCLALAPTFWRCRQDRLAALVELARLPEAREEAARLMAALPAITTRQFNSVFADSAAALRDRRRAAAVQAGIPVGRD